MVKLTFQAGNGNHPENLTKLIRSRPTNCDRCWVPLQFGVYFFITIGNFKPSTHCSNNNYNIKVDIHMIVPKIGIAIIPKYCLQIILKFNSLPNVTRETFFSSGDIISTVKNL